MLSAARPSRAMTSRAAAVIRSRVSWVRLSVTRVQCSVRCTQMAREEGMRLARALGVVHDRRRSSCSWPLGSWPERSRTATPTSTTTSASWLPTAPRTRGSSRPRSCFSGSRIAALAPALLQVLPIAGRRGWPRACSCSRGAAIVAGGLFNADCSTAVDATCQARWDRGEFSTAADIHDWAGLAAELLFIATPFALARALWGQPAAAIALVAGVDRAGDHRGGDDRLRGRAGLRGADPAPRACSPSTSGR